MARRAPTSSRPASGPRPGRAATALCVALAGCLLTACGGGSAAPARTASPSRPSAVSTVTPAGSSSSDDQPQRHTPLAHATCVTEVVLGAAYVVTHGQRGDDTVARTFGQQFSELIDETLPAVMTPEHPSDLSAAAGRRAARLAGTNCRFGANPADDQPNEVLSRAQVGKLRRLLPSAERPLVDRIHYFG